MIGQIRLKSIADPAEPEDGCRVLVTRYRPSGKSTWSYWDQRMAPSRALLAEAKRKGKSPSLTLRDWEWYSVEFRTEMGGRPGRAAIKEVAGMLAAGRTVTLLCFCRDESRCHRSLLRELIMGEVLC